MAETLQDFWAEILSAEADRVRSAMEALSTEERRSVIAHLRRMAGESGWTEGQRARAQAALDTLGGGANHEG